MGQFVKENAHLRTDLKKYQDNFDSIDWSKKKEIPGEKDGGKNEVQAYREVDEGQKENPMVGRV